LPENNGMRKNFVFLLASLVLVGLVVRWTGTPPQHTVVTETVEVPYKSSAYIAETRVNSEVILNGRGYQVDGLSLGDQRETVERFKGESKDISKRDLRNGLSGEFPNYYGEGYRNKVAYDLNNRIYCLEGQNLTLPDGQQLNRYCRVSTMKASLGEPTKVKAYERGAFFDYPDKGLSFHVYKRTVGREMEMECVVLSPPWKPETGKNS
jgi:hypothetical protein